MPQVAGALPSLTNVQNADLEVGKTWGRPLWPPRATIRRLADCPYKFDERSGNVYENKGTVQKSTAPNPS
jgi:hypothetical protein